MEVALRGEKTTSHTGLKSRAFCFFGPMESFRTPLPALLAGLISSSLAKDAVDQNLQKNAQGRTIPLEPIDAIVMCYIAGPPIEGLDDPMAGLTLERDFQDQMRANPSDPKPDFLARSPSTDPNMARCLGHIEGLDTSMVEPLSRMFGQERQLGVRVRAHRAAKPATTWRVSPDDCRLLAAWFGSREFDKPLSVEDREILKRNLRLRVLLAQ